MNLKFLQILVLSQTWHIIMLPNVKTDLKKKLKLKKKKSEHAPILMQISSDQNKAANPARTTRNMGNMKYVVSGCRAGGLYFLLEKFCHRTKTGDDGVIQFSYHNFFFFFLFHSTLILNNTLNTEGKTDKQIDFRRDSRERGVM